MSTYPCYWPMSLLDRFTLIWIWVKVKICHRIFPPFYLIQLYTESQICRPCSNSIPRDKPKLTWVKKSTDYILFSLYLSLKSLKNWKFICLPPYLPPNYGDRNKNLKSQALKPRYAENKITSVRLLFKQPLPVNRDNWISHDLCQWLFLMCFPFYL